MNTSIDPARNEVFYQNLTYTIGRIAEGHTDEALDMLAREFPDVRDFRQLRSLAQAFVDNDCKSLRRMPAPPTMELEKLSEDLRSRFHQGNFHLTEREGLVVHEDRVYGPFERQQAIDMARKMSAASPTNDTQGHVLDPENAVPSPSFATPLAIEV
jgi:hypothetical protein